jgi:N-acetylglucosamine-6-phosphate deacetylase
MLVGTLDADHATHALERHHGRLRAALDDVRHDAPRASTKSWTRLGVGAALVDGTLVHGDVAIDGGQIMAVGLRGSGSGIAIRGFVDAQLNGYAGVDLLSASVEDIVAMSEALKRDGVTAYQPNLITSDIDTMLRAMTRLREARRTTSGARILDFHLEGPFLSPLRAGTHPREQLASPDVKTLDALLAGGDVVMMTIAPELPGSLDLIQSLVQRGIVVALGHSAATSAQARQGFEAGASTVTHLFNAMEPITARSPGLAGVALSRDDVIIQLLGDGVHVADELLLVAFRAASQRCVLVTDAIAAAASSKSTVQLGEVTVHVKDGVARRDDGTIAGSIGRLRDTVTRVRAIGVDQAEVLRAVTTTPSNLVGQPGLSDVRVGQPADLVVLDEHLRITRRLDKGLDAEV